ncbi:MAG: hypothetical protein Q8916_04840 [Bacteroidota bacterium]|nr:hypothetical protein [Bacteroidota bacterium]
MAGLLIAGCATHRSANLSWEGERVRVQFSPPDAGSPVLKCLSCNRDFAPLPLQVNDQGLAYIKIDEIRTAFTSHFRIIGSGIDTALTLQPLPPKEVTERYKLKDSLIGRAMALRYAVVYKDTTMTEQVGSLERQDEMNLFGEDELFYYIHHPLYTMPVVILRSQAVRIQ